MVVDTQGNLLRVTVHPANLFDAHGAPLVLGKLTHGFERLSHFWADRAYRGALVKWVADTLHATMQIVALPDGTKQFSLLPRRWVVERSWAWLGRYRRLSKDYEVLPLVSEAFIYLASIRRLLHHLAHP